MKTLKYIFLTVLFAFIQLISLNAQQLEISGSRKSVKTSGDVLLGAAPLAALTTIIILEDWQGLKQGAFTGLATVGVSYGLKYAVKKERPDHSDNHSFPSFHTAAGFAAATFVQKRYGWQWGVPSYAVATYIGWSRVYGKKHDWWDVVAGAAIGTGSSWVFTKPFARKHHLAITPIASDTHFGLHASIVF